MRLDKREITLNEQDSLRDILFLEKALLLAYVEGLERANRKEIRERLLDFIKETAGDLFLVSDLLKKLKNDEV